MSLRRKLTVTLEIVRGEDGSIAVLETQANIRRLRQNLDALERQNADEADEKRKQRNSEEITIGRATIAEIERVRDAAKEQGRIEELVFSLHEATAADYMAADRASKEFDAESGQLIRDVNVHNAELIRRCLIEPAIAEVEGLPMRVYTALTREFKALCEPSPADLLFL